MAPYGHLQSGSVVKVISSNIFKNYKIKLAMLTGAMVFAYVFWALNIPLPWMLGPMISTILLKLKWPDQVFFSLHLRNFFLVPLGYNIGIHITLAACQEIINQFTGIALSTFVSVGISLLLAFWTTRTTGVSLASSSIGNMPGGLTPMLLLCENVPKADINVVAILQSLRLIGTIAIVPILLSAGFGADGSSVQQRVLETEFLDVPFWQLAFIAAAGAFLGHYLHMPAEFLLGPIITTGIFSLFMAGNLPEAPNGLIAVAQIATGVYLGTCIDPFQLGKNKKLLPVAIVGVFAIVASSLVTGYFISHYFGFTVATAFLACAPGGIAEMCVTGMVLGENVAIILAYQLFRMLFLNFVMPISLKWYFTNH